MWSLTLDVSRPWPCALVRPGAPSRQPASLQNRTLAKTQDRRRTRQGRERKRAFPLPLTLAHHPSPHGSRPSPSPGSTGSQAHSLRLTHPAQPGQPGSREKSRNRSLGRSPKSDIKPRRHLHRFAPPYPTPESLDGPSTARAVSSTPSPSPHVLPRQTRRTCHHSITLRRLSADRLYIATPCICP